MTSEETKIMTFKSHDNRFSEEPGVDGNKHREFYEEDRRVNQTNVHQQNPSFEPAGTYDKRGSINTLS